MATKMDEAKGINRKLTEAWACRDLYAEYNGCELDESSYVDFEAVFGGPEVKASLIFLDNEGFTSSLNGSNGASPTEGGILKMGYTDCLGCPIENTYIIGKVTQQTDKKNQKLVHLELTDVKSRRMRGAYKAKGYPEKKYSEAIEEHFKELKIEDVAVIPNKIEQKINMVVSQGINFFDTLTTSALEKGYKFIQDRAKSYFSGDDNLGFSELPKNGEVFVYDTNELAANRIVQFSVGGFNSDALLSSVKTDTTSDDDISVNSPDNKDGIKQASIEDEAKKSKNDASLLGATKVSEAIHTVGTKLTIKPAEGKEYFNALKEAQKLSIWVPGRNINRIGSKVEVQLPRPKFYSGTEYDKTFIGDWEVYIVRDKIIGWYFMQEIFLRRPGKG